jgi:hypothetical protein
MKAISDAQWETYVTSYFEHLANAGAGWEEADAESAAPLLESSNRMLNTKVANNITTPISAVVAEGLIGTTAGTDVATGTSPVTTPVPASVVAVSMIDGIAPSLITRPDRIFKIINSMPFIMIEPVPVLGDPLSTGDFLLWPDPAQNRAFFALAAPRLSNFSLKVINEVRPGGTISITGGVAVLTLSVYTTEDLPALERYRQQWTERLAAGGYTRRNWKFLPLDLRNLQATLSLSAISLKQQPRVTANAAAGTVTFLIELSESGALEWKEALEQRRGHSILGFCDIKASYCALVQNRIRVKEQNLSAPLSRLLARCGPESVTTINPQQTATAKLVVDGDQLLEKVVVNLLPGKEAIPQSKVFGAAGGEINLNIASQNLEQVRIKWTAEWNFKSSDWPVIPDFGELSSSGWFDFIKPSEWIYKYMFVALLVDMEGKPVSNPVNYRVQGSFTYTARYLPTGKLDATFEAENGKPVDLVLPKYPQQPAGELLTFVAATVQGKSNVATRRLSVDNPFVTAKIYPDARIKLIAATDPVAELSWESELFEVLDMLK